MMRQAMWGILIITILALGGCTEDNPGNGTDGDAGATGCTSDKQCSASKQICNPLLKKCVDCLLDSHCASNQHCKGYKCVPYTTCKNSLDCKNVSGKPICSKTIGECVACDTNQDCNANEECIKNACVAYTACKNSKDCTNQVCDSVKGKCVDCLVKSDCGKNQECTGNKCKTYYPCKSDKDCTDKNMLCDKAAGRCKACLQHSDCPAIFHCKTGECVLDLCTTGQSTCVNNGVAACNKVGDGYDAPTSCGNQVCKVNGLTAKCEAKPCSPPCTGATDSCVNGTCKCGTAPSCSGTTDTCVTGSCLCGSALACSGSADTCVSGACKCGTLSKCSGSADTCVAGACKCGKNTPPCSGAADTCTSGLCTCGSAPACSVKSDTCVSGVCKCGSGAACTGSTEACVGGTCKACTNQCQAGLTKCSGNGVSTCKKMSNGCTDWGLPVACPSGQTCSGGKCSTSTIPTTSWATSLGGKQNEWGGAITVDSAGNSYVLGTFKKNIQVGKYFLTLSNSSTHGDLFVAKMDSKGTVLWAKAAGGSADDKGFDIAVDGAGNVYIAGKGGGSPGIFGTISLPTGNKYWGYVAKLDKNGTFLWAKNVSGTLEVDAYGVGVDASGNCYFAGSAKGSASIDNTPILSNGGWEVYVIKLDSKGKIIWVSTGGGPNNDKAFDLEVSSTGESSITGYFEGTATFGKLSLTSMGKQDLLVARVDKNGVFLWATGAGGAEYENGTGIALDSAGNSYITGLFGGNPIFGKTQLFTQGTREILIAKLDIKGSYTWAIRAGGIGNLDYGHDIAVDGSGNSYVTGTFTDKASFGTYSVTSKGSRDAFVTKVTATGGFSWLKTAGSTGDDKGVGIALDGSGNIYTTGEYQVTVGFGKTNQTSVGDRDIFVWKIGTSAP